MKARSILPPSPELGETARALLDRLAAEFPLSGAARLEWRRFRASAGRAHYEERLILLSSMLLTDVDRLERTLKHEYAHLLAFDRHGRAGAGHGAAWRRAMADLGLPPVVRHDYPTDRNQPRQAVTYRCQRCGSALIRKRRLPRRRMFVHASCGGSLQLESVVSRESSHGA